MMSTDPTKVELEFDPQRQKMSGYTMHGNIPFSVPYMTEVAPGLWQGGCTDGLILPPFIDHVVSLYPWETYQIEHEIKSKLEVWMYDSIDQSVEEAEDIADWVTNLLTNDKGEQVLVHCQAGLNRSSLVVALTLMRMSKHVAGWPETGEEAIALIREKRCDACLCNPAFESYIKLGYVGY